MKMMEDGSRMRNATSKKSWLWHDEDELLKYQPEVFDHFHHRYRRFYPFTDSYFLPIPECSTYLIFIGAQRARTQQNCTLI